MAPWCSYSGKSKFSFGCGTVELDRPHCNLGQYHRHLDLRHYY